MTDLLIYYMKSFAAVCDPKYYRKPNLALCHLITYHLEVKYNIIFGSLSDHILSLLKDKSFYIFYSTRMCSPQNVDEAEEDEEQAHREQPHPHYYTTSCLA